MSIISLRKTVAELDESELREAAQHSLSRCIETAGQYALEISAPEAETFRNSLKTLAGRATGLREASALEQLCNDFRGECRAYRDRFQGELAQLRSEVEMAVVTMQKMIIGVEEHGGDHEDLLRHEFDTLDLVAQKRDFDALHQAIQHAAAAAFKSCDDIRRSREVIIAQLQDEIQNLHRTVEEERRTALTDPATGLWGRTKLDARIKDLLLLNETFSVFFAGIHGLDQAAKLDARLSPLCLKAVAGRLSSLAGKNGEIGMAGRWSEEVFAVIFKLPLAHAPVSPSAMRASLSGDYSLHLDGSSCALPLQAGVHAVERFPDTDEASFYVRLGQAAFSVTAL